MVENLEKENKRDSNKGQKTCRRDHIKDMGDRRICGVREEIGL